MTDGRQYACPKGHRDIRKRVMDPMNGPPAAEPFYCKTCGEPLPAEEVDEVADEDGA